MELPAKYDPALTEDKWYAYWLENKFFHSEPDEREPYTVVIPPPNVTGILHMGHVLNNTLNDVLVRKARMDGKNACWVPGTDHASIATENKVVQKLAAEGIKKEDLTREEFLKHAWEWKEKHGGIILSQLRKLGASCDWDRTKFTMDPDLSDAVISTFVYFYNKGYIYRGVRMVNWDPVGLTAVSDEEVVHKDTVSKFYHLRYFISDGNGNPTDKYIIIATTRPETIMADAAICINPEDQRYEWLRGKKVLIPLINKEIPIIEDSYVAMDFGTGCLKVTPAHDVNDYEIGMRHNLPVLDIIDDHGRLNEKAQILVGEDRFDARKKIVGMLQEAGNLEKMEDYTSPIGYSERTNAVIEPRLSMQWFLKMDELAKDALESVESGAVKLIPDKYRNTYRHWMENVRDWCISRQLWWGQRIPAYYLPDGQVVVCGILLIPGGALLGIYYLTHGIFYDRDTFLHTTFGNRSRTCRYADIRSQRLYRLQGGSYLVELYLTDGTTVSVQTAMPGALDFLDHASHARMRHLGLNSHECEWYQPDRCGWFPEEEV